MRTNIDKYKTDLDKLLTLGRAMELDLNLRHIEEEEGGLTEAQKKAHKEVSENSRRSTRSGTRNHLL
ncbi:hypothetical protein YTPLAS72_03310 [Nitrospira sp.]|nr:hypothetical protein YTPLAS72_03310 [Nitrospira sp.]